MDMHVSLRRPCLAALLLLALCLPLRHRAAPPSVAGAGTLADRSMLTPGWSVVGARESAALGISVASAGDVNRDSYADIVVGAPGAGPGDNPAGKAFVYHGTASGLSVAASWETTGQKHGAMHGEAVAGVGDVNGDGFDDVLIGAPAFNTYDDNVGQASLYAGSSAGLEADPMWVLTGDAEYGRLGQAVSGAGDINGDGYSDLLIGVPYEDTALESAGCAYLYLGATDLGIPDGEAGDADWSICGETLDENLGYSLAGAGDINGDGKDDVIIGAPYYRDGEERRGRAYLFYGSEYGLEREPDAVLDGDQDEARFGEAVAGAGDVNGDGYDDVLVGASSYSSQDSAGGRAYVFYGSVDGIALSPAWSADGSDLEGCFGQAVAAAGDPNGDGYADVAIGAPFVTGAKPFEGGVSIYHGSTAGLGGETAWVAAGYQADAGFGFSVADAGDLDGDGADDLLVGAPGHSTLDRAAGKVFAYLSDEPPGASFVVDSNNDGDDARDASPGDGICADSEGSCTLRAAIEESNSTPRADVISFASPMTIRVDADFGLLPLIEAPVTIDASSVWVQASDAPGVVLDGSEKARNGLIVQADTTEIYGLQLRRFTQNPIHVSAASSTIGGPEPGQRNVIGPSGGSGVALHSANAHDNVVQGNYVGLNESGDAPRPNFGGMWIAAGASHNIIGGWGELRANVVSGNLLSGVHLQNEGTDHNLLIGNILGLPVHGTVGVGNAIGVQVSEGAEHTQIGLGSGAGGDSRDGGNGLARQGELASRPTARQPSAILFQLGEAGNRIGGNLEAGVKITGSGGPAYVAGNRIEGNGGYGIQISGRSDCVVVDNEIAGNGGHGVLIAGSTALRNLITANSIHSNAGDGIVLHDGANGGVSAPTIRTASDSGATGTTCQECTVEVFSDAENEGALYHGETQADAVGFWSFEGALVGPFITAVTHDAFGSSSSFSAARSIAPTPTHTTEASPSPTATPQSSPSPTATAGPTISPTGTESPMPASATPTAGPSDTPSPSATPTPSPGRTNFPTPSVTDALTETPTPSTTAEPRYLAYVPYVSKG